MANMVPRHWTELDGHWTAGSRHQQCCPLEGLTRVND